MRPGHGMVNVNNKNHEKQVTLSLEEVLLLRDDRKELCVTRSCSLHRGDEQGWVTVC